MKDKAINFSVFWVVIISILSTLFLFCFGNPHLYAKGSQPETILSDGSGSSSTSNTESSKTVTFGGDTIETDEDGRITFKSTISKVDDDSNIGTMNHIILKYRLFISGVAGFGTLSMILFFIMNLGKLGAVATNSKARSEVIRGLTWSAIGTAGLGSVFVIVGFFYRIFL